MDSVPKVHVKEANDHLQRMFSRIIELEELGKQQASEIVSKDEELQKLRTVVGTIEEREKELTDLREKLASSEATVKRLVLDLKEREAAAVALKEKARHFDCILSSRAALERIVETLQLYGGDKVEANSEDSGVSVGTEQEKEEDET
ncbi:uncharacterized protein LOC134185160 [Corticium candelabrum]|uniref:uncharacterized protein LOC134185160 n=1 Tax=Corticium candelabrum TaxID=121492 RepID=UPI002E256BAA|nr:uncharacterized protein LOC134185160 [Corticium candelabrum]